MFTLTNKVTLVTGASSGIGRAAAKLFAKSGAKIVLTARRGPELEALAREIGHEGGEAAAFAGDVSDETHAEALVAFARQRFGGLDLAFNNAGTLGAMGPTENVSRTDWEQTLAINLTSAFLAAKYQIPAMLERGGGSIVFTSTFVGYTAAFPGVAAYAASKAGVIGLTKALAVEYATRGIRVNALLPGGTDTPMGRVMANSPEALAFVQGLHAMKRISTPEEMARSALYLLSDAASFTTGSALLVDGGVSISRG
jgi:NAD(P)-dependent dehydrogenase (short-subunit alcohol dehydrogenase family)